MPADLLPTLPPLVLDRIGRRKISGDHPSSNVAGTVAGAVTCAVAGGGLDRTRRARRRGQRRIERVLASSIGIAVLVTAVASPAAAETRNVHLGLALPPGHESFELGPPFEPAVAVSTQTFEADDPSGDPGAEGLEWQYGSATLFADAPGDPAIAQAATVDSIAVPRPLPNLGKRLAFDLRDLVTAPLRMSGHDWAKVGVGALIVGAASLADDSIRDFAQQPGNGAQDTLIDANRPLANGGGFLLMGTSWLVGRGLHRRGLQAMAVDGFEASLIAAGVITPALKIVFGRERPREDLGPHAFGGSGHSFPSGETTQAFALASVVAAHYHQRWLRALSWSLAGVTAWGRIRADGHWASDVVAGAMIGAGLGRWIVHRNRPELRPEGKRGPRWSVAPEAVPGGEGLAFRLSW